MNGIQDALTTLAAKINALDLSETEEAVLTRLITGRGEEADVAGFGLGAGTVQLRTLGIGIGERGYQVGGSAGDASEPPLEEVSFVFHTITWT